MTGDNVVKTSRTLADLAGLFADEAAYAALPPDTPVYEVSSHFPVPEGTPGGLFFGLTRVYPGKVGEEYFMTKGHFHRQTDRPEYYNCREGEGLLLLMDGSRTAWAEWMHSGTLHYIPGDVAHRVYNIGSRRMLSFAAVWPSDAGHDYESIAASGFSARIQEVDGFPQIVF
ncbi:MAG: glucose-6-phosphate isomerase [Tannerella sp.]|nr:glucose-6-phosphate isomerase [Tannerella sp.]